MNRQFTVTLVRHGETPMNAKRVLQGHTDTPLSAIGIEQAEKLGKYFHGRETFTRAYASNLQRAMHTADIVLQHSGNSIEASLDKRLSERGFGVAEGRNVTDVHEEAKRMGIAFHSYTPVGAEALGDVQDRVKRFLEDLCKLVDQENDCPENVLIVTHGGLIVAMMRFLLSSTNYKLKNFNESSSLRIPRNTGFSKFTISTPTNGSSRVIDFITLNDTQHLDL